MSHSTLEALQAEIQRLRDKSRRRPRPRSDDEALLRGLRHVFGDESFQACDAVLRAVADLELRAVLDACRVPRARLLGIRLSGLADRSPVAGFDVERVADKDDLGVRWAIKKTDTVSVSHSLDSVAATSHAVE